MGVCLGYIFSNLEQKNMRVMVFMTICIRSICKKMPVISLYTCPAWTRLPSTPPRSISTDYCTYNTSEFFVSTPKESATMYMTHISTKKTSVHEQSLRSGQQMSFSVYGIDYSIGCLSLLKVVRKGIWSSAPTCIGWFGALLLGLFLGLGLLLRSLSPRTFAMGDYYIFKSESPSYDQ